MRAERLQAKIAALTAERYRLRAEAHRKIAESGKTGNEKLSDAAEELFTQAAALDGRIDALNQAVESAVDHDNADKRAAFLVETAAKVKLVADLAEARIKVAAVVDEKFVELKTAFRDLCDASNVIEYQVRQIVRVRDEGLDPSRRGEKIAVAMLHASGDSPAMMEALGQSVNNALPYLATSGLIELKAPIGDPARAHLTLAAAADVAAHGLRQRLLAD